MKIRKLKIYIFLFILSLSLSFMIQHFINNAAKSEQLDQMKTQKIIVIKDSIRSNEIVNAQFCELKDYPMNLVPEGALTDFVQITGQKTSIPLFKGDVLTKEKLSPLEAGTLYHLEQGERALFLPIKDPISLSPNDRVDIVLTHKFKKIKDGLVREKTQSHILLQYARLLNVTKADKANHNNALGVTLAIPKEAISKVLLGAEMGKISFVKYPDIPEELKSNFLKVSDKDLNFIKKKKKNQEVTLIQGQKIEQHVFKN